MRQGFGEVVNMTEASLILGVSDQYLTKKLVKKGTIKVERHPVHNMPFIRRVELVRFMVEAGYSPESYRFRLQPRGGIFLACGATEDVRFALRLNAVFTQSPLSLGIKLTTDPCWGILLDFDGLGRSRSIDIATEIRGWEDFPLLIALTGEDEASRVIDPVPHFDLVLSRPISGPKLAAAVRQMRRSVIAAAPRIADPAGRRFKKVSSGGSK